MYDIIHEEIKTLLVEVGEKNKVANLAIITSLIKTHMTDICFVGFYIREESELVVGPFQGEIPKIRMSIGDGLCGIVARNKIVDTYDTRKEIGDEENKNIGSEVALPIVVNSYVKGVLNIKSEKERRFNETDIEELEKICEEIVKFELKKMELKNFMSNFKDGKKL
jgi:L-methionine (R)-S-oxide reductase